MPYITDENRYPLCSSNKDLGELGPGYPLFLEFIKYLVYLMLFITFLFYIPVQIMIMIANSQFKDETAGTFARNSFGAFVSHAGEPEYFEKIDYEDRQTFATVYFNLVTWSLVFMLLFLIFMRRQLLNKAMALDLDA